MGPAVLCLKPSVVADICKADQDGYLHRGRILLSMQSCIVANKLL